MQFARTCPVCDAYQSLVFTLDADPHDGDATNCTNCGARFAAEIVVRPALSMTVTP